MDIGLLFRLPLSVRGYLVYQAVGSLFVNAVLNFGFAWQKHGQPAVAAFGGRDSAAFDTCLTALLLTGLTVVSGSWFVRRDRDRGVVHGFSWSGLGARVFPAATLPRAIVFAGFFTAWVLPLALLGLNWSHRSALTFPEFLEFKLGFACILGVLVTPLNAAVVLAHSPQAEHTGAAVPAH